VTGAGALELWEAGLTMTPAARALLLLEAAGHPDAAAWPVGARDQALLRSCCGAGGALAAVAECPGCGTPLDLLLDPAQLGTSTAAPHAITVDHEDYSVQCRLPTAGDLDHLDPHTSLDIQQDQLLSACVLHATCAGAPVELHDLPPAVIGAVERALEEADPGADLRLILSCAECGTEWDEELDPVRFAWTTVEQVARTLATDVHALARAYGWSEAEILDLSPFRRHLYLSAVQP